MSVYEWPDRRMPAGTPWPAAAFAQLWPRIRLTWSRRVLQWPVAAAVFLMVFAAGGESSAATARSAASRRRASENRETR
jgi:hypothetical protein